MIFNAVRKPFVTLGMVILGALIITAGCQQAPAASPTAAKPAAPAATSAPAQPATPAPTQAAAPAPAQAAAPTQAAPTTAAAASTWKPNRTIQFVVPFGAGTSADTGARKLAALMEKQLGGTIEVVDKPGAGGAVGQTAVKTAKPDGYTVLWASAAMATLPAIGNVDYDYKAFDNLARVSTETVTLAVKADGPYKTLADFLAAGKTKPLAVGNSGIGSFTHLAAVAIASKAGVQFSHVAFGDSPAVTAVLGGHIDASVQHPTEIMSAYKSGQARILGVTSEQRVAAFKDVPTFKEQGVDLVMENWRGIATPVGTPKDVDAAIEAAALAAANSPDWKSYLDTVGSQLAIMDSKQYSAYVADQTAQIAQLAKQVNLGKKQ